jgi:hypothetical protein
MIACSGSADKVGRHLPGTISRDSAPARPASELWEPQPPALVPVVVRHTPAVRAAGPRVAPLPVGPAQLLSHAGHETGRPLNGPHPGRLPGRRRPAAAAAVRARDPPGRGAVRPGRGDALAAPGAGHPSDRTRRRALARRLRVHPGAEQGGGPRCTLRPQAGSDEGAPRRSGQLSPLAEAGDPCEALTGPDPAGQREPTWGCPARQRGPGRRDGNESSLRRRRCWRRRGLVYLLPVPRCA